MGVLKGNIGNIGPFSFLHFPLKGIKGLFVILFLGVIFKDFRDHLKALFSLLRPCFLRIGLIFLRKQWRLMVMLFFIFVDYLTYFFFN